MRFFKHYGRYRIVLTCLTMLASAAPSAADGDPAASDPKILMRQAVMYLHGRGVEADVDKAIALYRSLAERDFAFAQYRLAQIYLDGALVPPDPERALGWLQRAALLGLVDAQLELSRLYEGAQGVAPDLVAAHKWLHIAASLEARDIEHRREALEQKMSFWQLTRARYLARRCISREYRGC